MPSDTSMYDYHAHIYFDKETSPKAKILRQAIETHFNDIDMGRFFEKNVGPHPRWSYQVAFHKKDFSDIINWLMLNRDGLTIFVHPQTGDALRDHRDHALWMGECLPLDLSIFG
ncbi:MAG: DOPA 4,5-dioxygenase family protein [Alphaproteobacteria bacterium]|nr:DOPA 4,5-dioxygenase family protein [Alphaproteobacteria bacterium]